MAAAPAATVHWCCRRGRWTRAAEFDRLSGVLPEAPLLATGAGHDAGVLSTHVPTGMLFVRNPTGVSHAPSEHVEDVDADAGADALADALQDLLGDPA